MLPEFYLNCLKSQLNASQLLTLEMLVWLLQFHKQVRIERLAACFPVPILYESRRRHIQRFLTLPQLSIPLLWFPLIKCILLTQIQPGTQVIVALDRTQWKENNLFVVSVIWHKRAWPIYWQFLEHQGSSNLAQQQALLRPVLRLLKAYEVVVVGDREFRSVELAYWLKRKKVYFALRQKQGNYILKRMTRRHSNFWLGLYGQMWIAALESCSNWVRNLMMIRPYKRTFFQRGLRAMILIQGNF
jgi:hypothetical protein